MIENKKKLRQQHNLWQVFELCGSLRLPCHVALSPIGSGHIAHYNMMVGIDGQNSGGKKTKPAGRYQRMGKRNR